MESLRFFGEFDLTLDEKSRVLVPTHLRRRIPITHGESFYLVVSFNRTLRMYPNLYYEWLVTQGHEPGASPTREQLERQRMQLAMATLVDVDKAGRILIPERAKARANLDKEVTLVGMWGHVEIWDAATWTATTNGLVDRPEVSSEQARMALPGGISNRTQTVTGMPGTVSEI